jgi:hypothetical protein
MIAHITHDFPLFGFPKLSSKAQGLFLHLELKRVLRTLPSSVFCLRVVHRSIAPLPPSEVEA